MKEQQYDWKYESINRWKTYYSQIDHILKNYNGGKVLNIGVGNHFVDDKLKRLNVNITTVDFNKNLNPDYIADIVELPFKSNSFNIVCAFEVLEHLPFRDFKMALKEMKRVSKRKILISMPYSCYNFYLSIKAIPFINYKDIEIRIPLFFIKKKYDGQHFWEIGRRNYPLKKIKKEIRETGLKIDYTWQDKMTEQIGFCLSK